MAIEQLYSLTSEGLHRKSEQECEQIFDKCSFAIAYVVGALNEDQLHHSEFQAKMKAVLQKNTS